ncbi:dihydrodipicolinate reductase [Frankia sp. CNm7]|uniref:Dihydrodipicolinate reductase n=1 Tax=Frankia nepalensis TaxID=1836974 RepID=A0A937ULM1_9ACTN|nr:dihydrodipicolinate reductase [Frankia nepalensis]MBL7501849.1 dihydrodipicolinate reductase [Frankia nepalensis]MBL7515017.1 dihydrodipicolinate reductase [Frankia nepalensis]MBL7518727.1 dihydrodipicolinate reductase [Frankia nepalensis]MBL7625937.1 dihydrodipicolinate reductase [Frankia nepalensis]
MKKLRVVQWTTGKTGTAAVRGMVGHPALEVVGCYAYSPDKVGRDVGTLAGIEPIGVAATDDVGALLALEPDCVAYMAYRPDFDHLERILESGVNIVTTMYMLAGPGYGEDVRDRLAAACERGGSSLYASGVYPGHAAMTVLAASAMCSRIDRVSLLESLDMSGYENEKMFRAMSIGLDPDDPAAPGMIEANCGSFKEQIRVLARALAVDLDEIRFTAEFGAANADTDFGFMKLEKGQIAGFKGVIAGIHAGRSVIECRFVWKLGHDMTPNWPVEEGYLLEIEGVPGVRVRLQPLGTARFDGAVTTAMPAINAIPQVVAAPPGIVNHADLPFVKGTHLLTRVDER